ncbi:MAG: hypothetical protein ACOCWR_05115 [Oceanidesulfovibrio sp.]
MSSETPAFGYGIVQSGLEGNAPLLLLLGVAAGKILTTSFTAVSSTPVSTIIFVSETTNSYHLLLPSLMVCFLCRMLPKIFSIYEEQVPDKLESPAHAGELFVDVPQQYKVRDMMDVMRSER